MSELEKQAAPDPASSEAFADLVACHLSGELSEAEREQLHTELAARPERRDEFVAICIHAQLIAACVGLEFSDEEELDEFDDKENAPADAIEPPPPPSCDRPSSRVGKQRTASFTASNLPIIIVSDTPDKAVGYSLSGWPMAYLASTVICAIGILILASIPVHHYVQFARQADRTLSASASRPSPLAPRPSEFPPLIGQITAMFDCQWSDPQTEASTGASVPLGRKYALSSGLMQITYHSGAKVVLQGPCTYEVESKTGGYLSVGKLTAKVEKGPRSKVQGSRPKAQGPRTAEVASGQWSVVSGRKPEIQNPKSKIPRPQPLAPSPSSVPSPLSTLPSPLFAVRTPTAIITDLGTEFGVEVRESGATSSTVFQGVVEVQRIARNGQPGQAVRLTENESACVERTEDDHGLTIRREKSDPAVFVRAGGLRSYAEEARLKAFRRWQAYSNELRHDPSLLAYYDFQQKPGEPSVLPNVAGDGDGSLDGLVRQAAWTTGRMPGKHALLFQNQDDYVELNLPQTADELTLAAWINVMSLRRESNQDSPSLNGILLSDNWGKPGQMHWQLDSNGCVVFAEYGLDREHNLRDWKSSPVFEQDRLRRWTHLAVSMDRVGRVWFYVDGRVIDSFTTADEERVPICIGPARIGTWNVAPRTFGGRIDEMAIFGRLLTADEIGKMFDAGNVTVAKAKP